MKITDKMAVTLITATRHASDTGNPVVLSLESDEGITNFTISPHMAVATHTIGRSMNTLLSIGVDVSLYGDASREEQGVLDGVVITPANGDKGFEIVFSNHDNTETMKIDAPNGIKFAYELEHEWADDLGLVLYEFGTPNRLCGINTMSEYAELSGDPDGESSFDFITITVKK